MMAAAQPFLSGAISKTVNLPETATVEEIADVYFQGWKLGLKALAVYRDNCKVGQPLSDAKAKKAADGRRRAAGRRRREGRREDHRVPADPQAAAEVAAVAHHVVQRRWRRGLHDRRLLPRRRSRRGLPQDGQAGLDPGRRDGRLLDRDLDRAAARCAAGDLRPEVHQPEVRAGRSDRRPGRPDGAVDHGLHLPPAGAGPPVLRRARRPRHLLRRGAFPSARHRLLRAGPGRGLRGRVAEGRRADRRDDRGRRGAPADAAAAKPVDTSEVRTTAEMFELITGTSVDAPLCFTCGTKMRPSGSCYVCEGCGSTSGCS